MARPEIPPRDHEQSSLPGLAGEVRAVVRYGLPVRASRAGPRLLALPMVKARASDPADRASLARALDALLREELDRLDHAELALAARLLFGAQPPVAGANLTARREAAAQAAGYEVNHFRKRIEPKIWDLMAWQVSRSSDAARLIAPVLQPARRPLVLPADVFAWEAAGHQQALAALWGAVYQLRAQLLGVAELVSMDAGQPALSTAAEAALWRYALVLHASAWYRACYGQALLCAAPGISPVPGPEQIAAVAGWIPELPPADELLLAGLADPEGGLSGFLTALAAARGGPELGASWQAALTGRDPGRTGPDQKEQ